MSHLRVLLAAQDADAADQVRHLLRDERDTHFELDWVASFDEALARMVRREYDAYLLSDRFDRRRGVDLLRAALDGGCVEPIILIGPRPLDDLSEALDAGAADALTYDELTPSLLQRVLGCAVERTRFAHMLGEHQERLIQAQRMESLGRLVGGVAHDFNNLLTGIIGYTSILEREIPSAEPSRKSLDEIRKAADLASALTRQLLAYSRKQTLRHTVLDVSDVVEGLADMLQRLIGEQISMTIAAAHPLPAIIADHGQVEQVILNLVLNARDATPSGGHIAVETGQAFITHDRAAAEEVDRTGIFVTLSVRDNGEGMSPHVRAHAFEPFFTTKPFGKGTGLGLSTVHSIVRQAGGFIDVTTDVGRGTLVQVFIPEAQDAQVPVQVEPVAEPLELQAAHHETVLVVEDDETVRNYIREALRFYGYQAVIASDPLAALRLAKDASEDIAVILTDIVLPDMSGMHLAAQLTTLRPSAAVVYMSGYIDARAGHAALPPDAHFLRKPFSPEELARLLRRALNGR